MVEVAARTGYSHVGLRLMPATEEERHFPLVADGALRQQTLRRLHDSGVRVLDIEIIRLTPRSRCREFEPLLAAGAELCDRAAPYGLHAHLEFMPWTDVGTLQQALRIQERAVGANGHVLVPAAVIVT